MHYEDNSPTVKALLTMIKGHMAKCELCNEYESCSDWDDHVECVCGHEDREVTIKPDGTLVMDGKVIGKFDSAFMSLDKPRMDGDSLIIHL